MTWAKIPTLYRLLVTALASSCMLFFLSPSPPPRTKRDLDIPPIELRNSGDISKVNISVLHDKAAHDIDAIIKENSPRRTFLGNLFFNQPKYRPFKPVLNSTERDILFDLAQKVAVTCSTLHIVCMMYGGTLLGSYRHHDLVPWDDDLDIFISHSHRGLMSRELKQISGNYHVEYAGPRIKFFSDQGSKNSKYPWKWPYIDISFFTENTTHIMDTAKDMRKYVYAKNIIFPVHKRPLGGLFLDAPRDTFAALTLTYASKQCQTYHYSHRAERVNTKIKHVVGCHDLADVYGFVHRSASGNNSASVLEKLVLAGRVIQTLNVQEPAYALTKPYVLELQ